MSQLAIATLATTFSLAAFSLSGGEKVDKNLPPINAKSKDEESFVKYVIQPYAPHRITSHQTMPHNTHHRAKLVAGSAHGNVG